MKIKIGGNSMKNFGKTVVRCRMLIIIVGILLLIPCAIGYLKTRTNYDVLTYLPKDIETMKGQDILVKDFGTGAFSVVVVEGMPDKDIEKLQAKLENVDHVKKVVWYGALADISIPEELLPSKIESKIENGDCKLMMVIYDSTMSSDETMNAVEEIRKTAGEQVFLSGMSAVVVDTKNLCDKEVPVYVGIAVLITFIVLSLTMDSFLIPVFFLLSIGMAVVYNLGTNFISGEISYITKALAAVLQLAVTMDYSIFLWHSYCQEKAKYRDDNEKAMADAINSTLSSVIGSSITTVAGFVALMFMSFTLGLDLGVVMAKGVILGVITCVTILPSLILIFDKAISKTTHRSLIPEFKKLPKVIVKYSWISILLFAILIIPALHGYKNTKVYYNLDTSLPKDLKSITANEKLKEEFNMNSTHMVLFDSNMSEKDINKLIADIKEVDGVKAVLGLESLMGPTFPKEMIPDSIMEVFDNGEYRMMLIMSEYAVASDEVNAQCSSINKIIKSYDSKAMLVGEAPCTKDLIDITNTDFNKVNTVSIGLVFLIIFFVFGSATLPIILICVIEFAIFINMGIPYYAGTVLPFVASIVIGTIQLGSTVDYAILMTNKYKEARLSGLEKKEAIQQALTTSMTSIIVSALTFFGATFGVGVYSEIDMISALCKLMARGALISMIVVITLLPAALRVLDGLIIHTTKGLRGLKKDNKSDTDAIASV